MKLFRIIILLLGFLGFGYYSSYAQNPDSANNNDSTNLYWKPKLEYAFTQAFSSSHEFAACQVFQKLDYNLAEIAQIRKVTPFPASLTVEFDGLEERIIETNDPDNASQTKVLFFKSLNIICEKVHYFDMVMEKATFGFPESCIELEYLDKGRLKFAKATKIDLDIKVSEDNLLEVMKLYPKAKALSSVKITIKPDRCSSKGRVKLGILVAEFKFNGNIKQLSPKKVNFICEKLTINGIPQPRAFVRNIMNYVNPVFDSSKVWVNLNVTDMKFINGYVVTKATVDKKEIRNAN